MRLESAFADRVTALALFLLGAATTYGGFVMDRLEIRRIHPASIPGLVPMILGVALMICALALAWSARSERVASEPQYVSWRNFCFAVVWSGLYALAGVGHVPFTLATGLYVAGFTLWFLRDDNDPDQRPGLLTTICVLAFSAITAIGISTLFRYGFLVRLP